MARLFGIVLMLLAIWYAASAYSGDDGEDQADADAAAQPESDWEARASDSSRELGGPSGRAAPSAVTSRVRDRVNDAVAEGFGRHTGERADTGDSDE